MSELESLRRDCLRALANPLVRADAAAGLIRVARVCDSRWMDGLHDSDDEDACTAYAARMAVQSALREAHGEVIVATIEEMTRKASSVPELHGIVSTWLGVLRNPLSHTHVQMLMGNA